MCAQGIATTVSRFWLNVRRVVSTLYGVYIGFAVRHSTFQLIMLNWRVFCNSFRLNWSASPLECWCVCWMRMCVWFSKMSVSYCWGSYAPLHSIAFILPTRTISKSKTIGFKAVFCTLKMLNIWHMFSIELKIISNSNYSKFHKLFQ